MKELGTVILILGWAAVGMFAVVAWSLLRVMERNRAGHCEQMAEEMFARAELCEARAKGDDVDEASRQKLLHQARRARNEGLYWTRRALAWQSGHGI